MSIGSGELIPYFALPAHVAFALPIKQSVSQPTSSPALSLQFPPLSHPGAARSSSTGLS